MSTPLLGMAIEGLVAILLATTIGYCWLLNKRLTLLRADEKAMRAVTAELVAATQVAERAVGSLKSMVAECDRTLSQRLAAADGAAAEMAIQIRAGETVLNRIALITEAARKQQALAQEPVLSQPSYIAPSHAPVAFAVPDHAPLHPLYREQGGATARAAAAVAEALAQRARARTRTDRGEAA